MLLIVGLGNPGEKYADTRHNIGFMVIDRLFQNQVPSGTEWEHKDQFNAYYFKKGDLVLAKPQTFMNASGTSVRKIRDFYKLKPENIWVVHDDIDLPLGKIRIRAGGGSAGHHGIESLMRELQSDVFVRFRLGVGRGKLEAKKTTKKSMIRQAVVKWVVSPFFDAEKGEMRKLIKHGTTALETALLKGLDRAMNEYN
jgi:PTH1 family peptidyl-tRNA hydrolase